MNFWFYTWERQSQYILFPVLFILYFLWQINDWLLLLFTLMISLNMGKTTHLLPLKDMLLVWMLKQGNLKLDLADLVFELFEVQRKYTNIVLTVQKPGRKTQGTQRHLPSQLTRNQNITMITKCTLKNSTSKWN